MPNGHTKHIFQKHIHFRYPHWTQTSIVQKQLHQAREKSDWMHLTRFNQYSRELLYHKNPALGLYHQLSQDKISLMEASKLMFKRDPSPMDLYVTFKRLKETSSHFVHLKGNLENPEFLVRPLPIVEFLMTTSNQKTRNPSLESFVIKAKEIILQSRQGKHLQQDLSQSDLEYIQLMKSALETDKQSIERHIVMNIILKKLEPLYSIRPDDGDLVQCLREIGVLSRLDNPILLKQPHLLIPLTNHEPVDRDDCERLRHTFDCPAFVIDGENAKELDDAISLETIGDQEWIHIHIADPTRLMGPQDPIWKEAQAKSSTLYLPERHYPILPPVLTKSKMDLGSTPYCLTFSCRLDTNGDILDYKIQPSYIKHYTRMTYDQLDQQLSWSHLQDKIYRTSQKLSPWVKTQLEQQLRKPQLECHPSLSRLQQLGLQHLQWRLINNCMQSDQPDVDVYFEETIPETAITRTFDHPNFTNKASVQVKQKMAQNLSPASALVSEMMILAGRVAAKHCLEHKLPVGYRGQMSIEAHLNSSDQKETGLLRYHKLLQERDPTTGIISTVDYETLLPYMAPAYHSFEPVGHGSMGIPTGYVKSTSPLRRFQDLFTHHQIKSSLLSRKHLDLQESKQIIIQSEQHDRKVQDLSRQAHRYWLLQWLLEQETPLPRIDYSIQKRTRNNFYQAIVINIDPMPLKRTFMILVPRLGYFKTYCIGNPFHRIKIGDQIQVMVEKVDPTRLHCVFRQI
ncbi:hypothetical protein EDD86DRAFT_250444 [Gorgonomyces haynaldii]|nr:hypothetical protein EDD86DRAFT_250444 [Gorgonomyces haynaldii]